MIAQFQQIDFYQHLIAGLYLFMLLWNFLPVKWQLYESRKRTVFLYTMSIGLLYEVSEIFWNMDAYSGGFRHYFLDSIVDMAAFLIVSTSLVFIIRDKK